MTRRCSNTKLRPIVQHVTLRSPQGPPYPPSPVIRTIEWAAADRIVRRAPGSDNWPMTWADDDALYTAYGDGQGLRAAWDGNSAWDSARITGGRAISSPRTFGPPRARIARRRRRGQEGQRNADGRRRALHAGAQRRQLPIGLVARPRPIWTWSDWTFTTVSAVPRS